MATQLEYRAGGGGGKGHWYDGTHLENLVGFSILLANGLIRLNVYKHV